jgi:polyphosphate kinase
MIRHIRDEILETYLADNTKSRLMLPNGTYQKIQPEPGVAPLNSQEAFISHARSSTESN